MVAVDLIASCQDSIRQVESLREFPFAGSVLFFGLLVLLSILRKVSVRNFWWWSEWGFLEFSASSSFSVEEETNIWSFRTEVIHLKTSGKTWGCFNVNSICKRIEKNCSVMILQYRYNLPSLHYRNWFSYWCFADWRWDCRCTSVPRCRHSGGVPVYRSIPSASRARRSCGVQLGKHVSSWCCKVPLLSLSI